ncbi:MAG: sigma-70 family RNA polymerase sigma factor [Pseudomonadota bacterium]
MHLSTGHLVAMPAALFNSRMVTESGNVQKNPVFAGLLEAVAQRQDRAAFARLFDHFAPRVKGYIRRLGASDPKAEDIVQEVMITVWRRAGLYDPAQASVSTWIFTIARNKRIDDLRRERRPEIDLNDPALVADPFPAADQLVTQEDQARRLREAVRALPEDQAEVLRKNFFEDKPHAVIAQELDLPLGTVKSRARLALAKLRQVAGDLV